METVSQLAGAVPKESKLFSHADCPFQAEIYEGHPKLVLVAGENASGKSIFIQVLAGWLQANKVVPVSISIRERVGAGGEYMRRAFMFGDESEQSTGATSAKTVETGFKQLIRKEGEKVAALILDEPELGLSEGYAYAMGKLIARHVAELPDYCPGIVVVSHSRNLVKGLVENLTPTFVKLGLPATLNNWLNQEERFSIDDLLSLKEKDREGWRKVTQILKAIKK